MEKKNMLLIAFALSGMTALIYEVVWTRPLQLIFGSTIYTVSTLLTSFLIGFSLGAFLFRNKADSSKNPASLFSKIEFFIGLYGFIILFLFKILTPAYLALESVGLQFILSFFVLIIPSTLFGATWPIMNKTYVNISEKGKDIGKLYSLNSFGSFLGPLAAGFLLIPLFGITTTCIIAASINVLIAIFVFVNRKKFEKWK